MNGTLSDDGNFFSGRMQFVGAEFGDENTFCVDTVNQTLAEITCLTVGYATVENVFLGQGGVFGEGQGEIYDRFECGFVDEDRFKSFSLAQCPVMNMTNTCDHSMDAGLACSGQSWFMYMYTYSLLFILYSWSTLYIPVFWYHVK